MKIEQLREPAPARDDSWPQTDIGPQAEQRQCREAQEYQDSDDDALPFPLSPPPMAWPRVFPSL